VKNSISIRAFLLGSVVLLATSAFGSDGTASNESLAYLAQHDGYWQVFVSAIDGSGERVVTHSPGDKSRVSWFPDGKTLLVNAQDGTLYKVGSASGKEERLTFGLEGMVDAVVSPDGQKVAFSLTIARGRDKNDIWALDLATMKAERIAAVTGLQDEPCWGPDGQTVYFSGGDGTSSHDLFALELRSGAIQQLTVAGSYHVECTVSSSGSIAYSGNRSGNYEIYSFDPTDPSTLTKWTDGSDLDGTPAWMPDGKGLIFASNRGGSLDLWAVRAPGATPRQITFNEAGARGPSVLPKDTGR
jgi:Tol biopolymer transport system component